MNASRLLEALFRIRRSPRAVPATSVPTPPAKRVFSPTSFEAAPPEVVLAAVQPEPAPAPVVEVTELEAPSRAKTMRSLEEVRADLARLRQTASERHALAQQPARHVDTSFARTDFMEIPGHLPTSSPRKKDASEFEPTAFADFAYPIPLLAR